MKNIIRSAACALVVAFIALSVSLTSCSKSGEGSKTETDSLQVKTFIDQMMRQFYYWADQMPSSVNKKGNSVEDYFNSLLVRKDRWSWMMNGETYNAMETGITTSYGFHISQPIDYFGDYDVYITYVDKNSPLGKAGVTRGWRLAKMNGTDVETLIRNDRFYDEIYKPSNKFTFDKPDGTSVDLNLSQVSFQTNSVSMTKIFTSADCDKLSSSAKVGYILFNTFNSTMKSEIVSALDQMKSSGVTDLILDLRYNGGGDLDVCGDMAGLLAPASADGKVFLTLEHNLANKEEDHSYYIKRSAKSLDLSRLFVITGSGTASASESLINCLNPYMDIQTVGGQTYGKPNGMYVFYYPQKVAQKYIDYAFLPICFYCMNSQGKADFDNGIVPLQKRYDDLYHDFSADEDLIKACLVYIGTGKYPGLPAKSVTKSAPGNITKKLRLDDGFKGAYVKKY